MPQPAARRAGQARGEARRSGAAQSPGAAVRPSAQESGSPGARGMAEDRARGGYWFKPKAFGYGATPTTWQGWLVVAAFILLVGALTRFVSPEHPAFFGLLAPAMIGLIWLSRVKTDGDWRWRP